MTFANSALPKTLSIEEYLLLEERAEQRHEYHKGKIIPMTGGTLNHNAISANLFRIIGNELFTQQKLCRILSSDMKIWITEKERFVYPDLTILCEEPIFYKNRKDVITNPLLIAEVLSLSTEAYDRGKKFENYSLLPSLKEYVLVDQYEAKVEVFYREGNEPSDWQYHRETGLDANIHLKSIDCTLSLKEVYHLIEFPPPPEYPDDTKDKKV